MTLPNPACVVIPPAPAPLRIRIPGGITIEGLPNLEGGIITALGSVQSLLQSLTPAMAALQPMFLIIDAVSKLMAVLQAVPGLVAGNLPDFLQAMDEAVKAVLALAQLEPSISLPLMLSDMITAMTTALQALKDAVVELQALSTQADAVIAQAQAAGDTALEAVGDCMKAQAEAYGGHVIASLGPLGNLMDMAGQLAGLMPAPPPLPTVGDATGMDLDELADFLDTMIAAFQAVNIPGA